ncbi:MAG: hypothetical protein IPL92_09205 [Saprospiraceae bacterium]|nr:hypothetical protein [Candidatus Opimibacter iunctus]
MIKREVVYIALGILTGFLLFLAAGFPFLDTVVWVTTLTSFYVFMLHLTRRVNFLDVTAMAACISYLLVPLVTYNLFGKENKLAALWQTYMTIDKQDYFRLALPGTIALIIGLWFPSLIKTPATDGQLILNVKKYLTNKSYIGMLLIMTGILAVPFVQWAPPSISAIFYFVSQLTYIGVIYLLHSNLQLKGAAIAFILILMVAQSILTGMYGELVYWSVMGVILMVMNKESFTMSRKLILISVGIVSLFLIQSIKHEYRDKVWKGAERGNDPSLFFSLIVDRIMDPASIFEPERMYKVVVRANQGYLVARSMDYVPKHEPFARGETILSSFASAIVPRFLWADKPKVGGQENICRFLGDCGRYNYSYNIGQLGEAYVNFGIVGGWIWMFFYGLMLNTLLNLFRYLSVKRPTLLLWTPLLFYPAMVVETDFLTFINTFVKGAMFCAASYLLFRLFVKIRL